MAATERQLIATTILMQHGISSSGACAIIGNFAWEAGGKGSLPTKFRTSNLDHGSQGLAQWLGARLLAYEKMVAAKHPELDQDDFTSDGDLWPWFGRLDYQLEFTVKELEGMEYQSLLSKLKKGGDIAALTADICWQYERPNKRLAHLAERIAFAKAIAAAMVKSPVPTDVTTHIAAAAHEEDTKQSQAVGAVTAGVVGVAGVAGYHVHLPWWLWIAAGLSLLIFVAGVIALIKAHVDGTNIKAAAPAVTPDAKPAVAIQPSVAPKAPSVTNDKVKRRRQQALLANEDTPKTLADVLKSTPASEANAHAAVSQQVGG